MPLDVEKTSLTAHGDVLSGGNERITIRLPPNFLRELDILVASGDFSSRSEAIRAAVRNLLYERVPMVLEVKKKMAEAELALSEMEAVKKEYLNK
jgi:Arc/MetJ-type ribon-helix-helix transcriptional regulator